MWGTAPSPLYILTYLILIPIVINKMVWRVFVFQNVFKFLVLLHARDRIVKQLG